MQNDEIYTRDPYAIAALTQRTPGFGFGTDGGPLVQRQLQYASILSRLGACLIDGLVSLLAIILIVVGLFMMDSATGGNPGQSQGIGAILIFAAAVLAFHWLYNVCQETSTAQATLGKRVVGIKVATLSGGRIGVPQATIRLLVKMVPGANPLLGLVSLVANVFCLTMNFSKNRTLHDLIAGTVVING